MIKFIKDTTWEEVFEEWRNCEADNPRWIRTATKIKGWPDWESWRRFTSSLIGAEKRSWKIYEFTDPTNDIPEMLVGPYQNWQKKLPEKNKNSFKELINIPENYEFFTKHPAVVAMMENFPSSAGFIGLIREDNRMVCLEGHHRATAIALAKKDGKTINFKGKVKIFVAELSEKEYHLLDIALERGSAKNSEV